MSTLIFLQIFSAICICLLVIFQRTEDGAFRRIGTAMQNIDSGVLRKNTGIMFGVISTTLLTYNWMLTRYI